jgi:hypothetical protein
LWAIPCLTTMPTITSSTCFICMKMPTGIRFIVRGQVTMVHLRAIPKSCRRVLWGVRMNGSEQEVLLKRNIVLLFLYRS